MKHFQYVGRIDTFSALHELQLHPELWNENDLRTAHPNTAHGDVSDIWLWFNALSSTVINDIQTVPYQGWNVIASARQMVYDLMHKVGGVQLGRVIITKLPPGGKITPHTDGGAPATFYRRYQIALQNLPGSLFHIEDESVCFQTGDVWWINNRAEHSVVNNSADDRIALIIDIRVDHAYLPS